MGSSSVSATANISFGTDRSMVQDEAQLSQYLTFILNGEEYGVDILRVQEIKGWEGATPIPRTPSYVRGVINLRGTVVPVIDLRARFGLEQIAYGTTTVIVVMTVMHKETSRTLGIVVDGVSEVCNVSPQDLKPAPEFGGAANVNFISGLATVDKKMVIILDVDRLLSSEELKQTAASLTKAAGAKNV